ncbi:MerR family transcriptional regulator [Streptomyces avicenniae]|uniref:DNA polymerase III subunit beta family protein n=1 Tax=Streptomyces avicenniae TaxID=500153 RepID=UPI000A795432|nr:MerR family transcriptional regulator [Streptomyces avicenniae]
MSDAGDTGGGLLSIGVFARRVGLTPSALRFYDDCGVLRPARVDAATGYRWYAPQQVDRAVTVRRLRAAGLPLVDARAVLDDGPDEARRVLTEHARRTRRTAVAAEAAIEEVLRELPVAARRADAWVGAAELASAVRQVAPAAASGEARARFPVLGHVLVELTGQDVRLVATDRYRLAVRVLHTERVTGGPTQVLVPPEELVSAAAWALRLPEVRITVEDASARLSGEGVDSGRELPVADGAYPSYRMVLDGMPPVTTRLIHDRAALAEAVREAAGREAAFVLDDGTGGPEPTRVVRTGPPVRLAFDPSVLLAALEAGVGPDVLFEVSSSYGPVVVRSADQGTFTTLVMPVRSAPDPPS